jgi:hypothetical protein
MHRNSAACRVSESDHTALVKLDVVFVLEKSRELCSCPVKGFDRIGEGVSSRNLRRKAIIWCYHDEACIGEVIALSLRYDFGTADLLTQG